MTDNATKTPPANTTGTGGQPAGPRSVHAPVIRGSEWLAFIFGTLALGLSVSMAGALVLDHFNAIELPGCGAGSACDQAARSFWGKLPGTAFPVSFVGFAYFVVTLIGWVAALGRLGPVGLSWARLGAAVSLFYVIIILIEGHHCRYCILAHTGNLMFLCAAELLGRCRTTWNQVVTPAMAGGFAVLCVILGAVDREHQRSALEKAESARLAAVEQMVARGESTTGPVAVGTPSLPSGLKGSAGEATAGGASSTASAATASSPKTQSALAQANGTQTAASQPILSQTPASQPSGRAAADGNNPSGTGAAANAATPFIGRYRFGPREAPIRIVMVTGYQCIDCQKVEPQLEQLRRERKDIHVTIKHFPFTKGCNRFMPPDKPDKQPNGCWAARAAEAAGILAGEDGFWRMHDWLFKQKGSFTNQELEAALPTLGFDKDEFGRVMQSAATLEIVKQDIEEAMTVGLLFTPMIFVNGVELKGWNAPNALLRTVESLAAKNLPALGPEADRPPTAEEKFIDDWRVQPMRAISTRPGLTPLGPENARIKIVVWGDYMEPFTAETDAMIRAAVLRRGDVQYTFRNYPFNSDCNGTVEKTLFPQSCWAAKLAIAAGAEKFWALHEWLMEQQGKADEKRLRADALRLGIDADKLLSEMQSAQVETALSQDVQHAQLINLRGIPHIMINGKWSPRWRIEGAKAPVLPKLIDAAAQSEPRP